MKAAAVTIAVTLAFAVTGPAGNGVSQTEGNGASQTSIHCSARVRADGIVYTATATPNAAPPSIRRQKRLTV